MAFFTIFEIPFGMELSETIGVERYKQQEYLSLVKTKPQ